MLKKLTVTLVLAATLLSVTSPALAVNDPGGTPRPVLESLWVFCKPGQSVILGVHTNPGNGYAVWTYNYNPLTPENGGFDTDYSGVGLAHDNPDLMRVAPGDILFRGVHVFDEILLVYVYGIPVSNFAPLIALPPTTHCL